MDNNFKYSKHTSHIDFKHRGGCGGGCGNGRDMQPTGGTAPHGMGGGGEKPCFYVDDGSIEERYYEWVHDTLTVTFTMF